jgi:hypothetical protein
MRRIGWTLLAGCAGDAGSGSAPTGETGRQAVELVQLADEGRACLWGGDVPAGVTGTTGGETTFTDGGPVTAHVVLDDCASGCADDLQASCEVRIVQTEVVVTATGSYTLPSGDRDCPSMCVVVAAECASDPLSAGTWTLDYAGGHSDGFEVPGTGPAPCAVPLF